MVPPSSISSSSTLSIKVLKSIYQSSERTPSSSGSFGLFSYATSWSGANTCSFMSPNSIVEPSNSEVLLFQNNPSISRRRDVNSFPSPTEYSSVSSFLGKLNQTCFSLCVSPISFMCLTNAMIPAMWSESI